MDLNELESLKLAFHELLSNSYILSQAYKNLRKEFNKFSKHHIELKEIHQSKDISSLKKTTQNNDAYMTLKKDLCLENEKFSKEQDTLMKGFHILVRKIEVLQKELKELTELQDHL